MHGRRCAASEWVCRASEQLGSSACFEGEEGEIKELRCMRLSSTALQFHTEMWLEVRLHVLYFYYLGVCRVARRMTVHCPRNVLRVDWRG